MGDAHLARPDDPRLSGLPRVVVVKRLLAELGSEQDFVARFLHEARVASLIDSKRVARLYDSGEVDRRPYMAIEHILGWPLSRVLSERARSKEPPELDSALGIALDCVDGLTAIHEARDHDGAPIRLVHRDVAPKNTMLGLDGHARLIDLGLGRSSLGDWLTRTGAIMGTPGYMAPEQARGERVDARADIYAVGVMLFELLTLESWIPRAHPIAMLRAAAEPPVRPPSRHRKGISPSIDAVVLRATDPNPAARFQSARELAAALEALLGELEPTSAARTWIGPRGPDDVAIERARLWQADGSSALRSAREGQADGEAEPTVLATRLFAEPPFASSLRGRAVAWVTIVGIVGAAFLAGLMVSAPKVPDLSALPAAAPEAPLAPAGSGASPESASARKLEAPTIPASERRTKPPVERTAPRVENAKPRGAPQRDKAKSPAPSSPPSAEGANEEASVQVPREEAPRTKPSEAPLEARVLSDPPGDPLELQRARFREKTGALMRPARDKNVSAMVHDLIKLRECAKSASTLQELDELEARLEEIARGLGQ